MYQIEASKTKLLVLSWVFFASVLTTSLLMLPENMMEGYIRALVMGIVTYFFARTLQALFSLIIFSGRVPRSVKPHLHAPLVLLLGVAWFLGYVLFKML